MMDTIKYRKIFLAFGTLFYLLSFFLPAVDDRSFTFLGYQCAILSLTYGIGLVVSTYFDPSYSELTKFGFSYWIRFIYSGISGLSNILLFVFVPLAFYSQRKITTRSLRYIILVTSIIFSWLAFSEFGYVPLIGYYFWVAGITIILYSNPVKHRVKTGKVIDQLRGRGTSMTKQLNK